MEWIEQAHPIFGKGGPEEIVHDLVKTTFPKRQWRSGGFSIIEPSDITFGQYEIYNKDVMDDPERFDTLEEAKDFAEKLTNPPVDN